MLARTEPPDAAIQALERLLAEDIAIFAPGHGHLIGAPHKEVQRLIAHRFAREAKVAAGRYFRSQRRFGTFSRTIGLPQGVTEDGVTAHYEHGVLQVHVRKPEQPKPRKIEIGVGPGQTTIEGKAEKK